MKYKITKRRYLDALFILLIGTTLIIFLTFFIKPSVITRSSPIKPIVAQSITDKFLYITNTTGTTKISLFNTITGRNEDISTASAQNIQSAFLFRNNLLYTHGEEGNYGLNIDTKKTFTNPGDYIAPDGKIAISEDTTKGILSFALTKNTNEKVTIPTSIVKTQIDKLLGWSPDSKNFYFSANYDITKQASKSATDHWMQKVGKEMKEMSRVRTWVETSTSSAVMVYRINTDLQTPEKLFTQGNIGVIKNAFYNNDRDTFYLVTNNGVYLTDFSGKNSKQLQLPIKNIAAITFATKDNTDRFLYTSGQGLSLADITKGTIEGLFYASNSAVITPLALTGNKAIFYLIDKNNFSGEILDIARKTRNEFIFQEDTQSSTISASPIVFGGWVKSVNILFPTEQQQKKP